MSREQILDTLTSIASTQHLNKLASEDKVKIRELLQLIEFLLLL